MFQAGPELLDCNLLFSPDIYWQVVFVWHAITATYGICPFHRLKYGCIIFLIPSQDNYNFRIPISGSPDPIVVVTTQYAR